MALLSRIVICRSGKEREIGNERERESETGFGHANNGCDQDDDAVSHSPNRRSLFPSLPPSYIAPLSTNTISPCLSIENGRTITNKQRER